MTGNAPFVVTLKNSLISWDLFVRAQVSFARAKDPAYPSFLTGKLHCWCGAILSSPNNDDWAVQCPNAHGVRLKIDEIERSVLRGTAKRLLSVSDEFRLGVNERMNQLEQIHEVRHSERTAEVASLNLKIKDIYRNLMTMDARAVEIGNELAQELIDQKEQLEQKLFSAGTMPRLVLPDQEDALAIAGEFADLAENLPLRPDAADDESTLETLDAMIREVRVEEREGETYNLAIVYNDIAGDEPEVAKVSLRDCNIGVKAHNRLLATTQVRDMVDKSPQRLTDEEWETFPLVKAIRKKTQFVRDEIDAILIWDATDINLHRLMKNMGYKHNWARRVTSFYARSRTDLIEHLRITRGADFNLRLPAAATRASEAARLRACYHPVFLLPVSRVEENVRELDDLQWLAVADLFPTPHHKATVLTYRSILDGYFALLRTEFTFNQASHVGFKESHQDAMAKFHASGIFNRVVQTLLKLEGYEFPSDYTMPMRPDGIIEKATVPTLADVMLELSKSAKKSDNVDVVPTITKTLTVGNIVLHVDTKLVTTKEGERVPLTESQMGLVSLFLERPGVVLTLEDLRLVSSPRDRRPAADVTVARRLVYLRRALRAYCPETSKAIVGLKGGCTFMFIGTPQVELSEPRIRRTTQYVVERGPTTLVQKIVDALKDGREIPGQLDILDFLLGGPARRAKHTSLAKRIRTVRNLLAAIYPESDNPLRHLCSKRRTKGALGDLQYEPTELGLRVRHALGLPPVGH